MMSNIVQVIPQLAIEYPVRENYSVVMLNCTDGFGEQLENAEFLKRVQDSPVPLSGSPNKGIITITLTQEGEGYFSCRSTNGSSTSSEIGLAGKFYIVCMHVHIQLKHISHIYFFSFS